MTRIHLDRLDIRLKVHDDGAARTLARDLPDALSAALSGRAPASPRTLAERVAADVAGRIATETGEDRT